ncbi:MAG: helix-turn-helix transcriptional regulator [Lutibacter sp.]|nr:helix-turn-helix transcriptional regulator [Lutibacter sp.]
MNTNNNIREKILNQPSYWVEGINGFLYDSIVNYMEDNNLNRTKLAEHLGISKGRVSQILNDGEINFSLEKIIEIALKVDKFPVFEFKNKQEYLDKEMKISNANKIFLNYDNNEFSSICVKDSNTKVIPLNSISENKFQLAL